MSPAAPAPPYPLRAFDVTIRRVRDLTAHSRRVTFAGPALERFGVPGPPLDLRIKLLLPVPGHPPARPGAPDGTLHEGWYQEWLRCELPGRGFIRSYTVRAVRAAPGGLELDVDFVLHADAGGHSGPASAWARAAAPGDGILIIGPDARAVTAATPRSAAGIRWNPDNARHVLLAGDETAVPAVSSILEALPAGISGHAFLEVADTTEFGDISTESGVRITWLARTPSGASRGGLLHEAVRQAVKAPGPEQLYAWVAAEASTVKNLRGYLVNQIGLDPRRSEFRAYWSLGKAGSGGNGTPLARLPEA